LAHLCQSWIEGSNPFVRFNFPLVIHSSVRLSLLSKDSHQERAAPANSSSMHRDIDRCRETSGSREDRPGRAFGNQHIAQALAAEGHVLQRVVLASLAVIAIWSFLMRFRAACRRRRREPPSRLNSNVLSAQPGLCPGPVWLQHSRIGSAYGLRHWPALGDGGVKSLSVLGAPPMRFFRADATLRLLWRTRSHYFRLLDVAIRRFHLLCHRPQDHHDRHSDQHS
jgi:hypothetical protein